MEEDICVNEYIRTKDGKIDKLHCEINKNSWRSMDNFGRIIAKCQMDTYLLKDIVKHNENVLNLLETADIAILEYCISKPRQRIKRRFEVLKSNRLISFTNIHCNFLYDLNKKEWLEEKGYNIKIKEILTHEQYERNCYRLEE